MILYAPMLSTAFSIFLQAHDVHGTIQLAWFSAFGDLHYKLASYHATASMYYYTIITQCETIMNYTLAPIYR